MLGKGFLQRARLLLYSRSFFRTCDIVCNHAARLADADGVLSGERASSRLAELNQKRLAPQRVLEEVGRSHIDACADCRGRCCHGPRERDTFIDRVVQDPLTPHRGARGPNHPAASKEERTCCPNLTSEGCTLPFEQRPIQCVTYFCQAAIDRLSPEQCAAASSAVKSLMGVQVETVTAAVSSRLRRRSIK